MKAMYAHRPAASKSEDIHPLGEKSQDWQAAVPPPEYSRFGVY